MVNYVALLVASLASFVIGMLWYGPLFGKRWMKEMGISEKSAKKSGKEGCVSMQQALAGNFVATLVMAYVLSMFLGFTQATTAYAGAVVGLWLWLGFVATTAINESLFGGKSLTLYVINSLNVLVSMLTMGAILAVWV